MMGLLLFGLLAIMLVLRQRLVVMLGVAAGYCYMVWGGGDISYVVLDMWAAADQEVLLSIPLFILAGNIMSRGSIARRLIAIMKAATCAIPGGLAIAAILSCAFFAAISGSSTVTLIAVGSVMYPALLAAGYDKKFALGLLCAAGTLGIIVPPSIPLILYGVMTETSITDLFKAGVGPAILLTIMMITYAVVTNWKMPRTAFDTGVLVDALHKGILSLLMPVVILGGIYTGWFTATESAAVAVFYAVVIELFVYRDMNVMDLRDTAIETSVMMGSLFPLLMMALSINTFMSYEQIPYELVKWMSQLVSDPISFLLITLVLLLIVGFFMDIGSAILIIAPLLLPLALAHGINPVHFGVVMISNLELGYLTPPLGLNLIVAMTAFGEDFWLIAKSVIPFLLIMLIGLIIITFVPALSLIFV